MLDPGCELLAWYMREQRRLDARHRPLVWAAISEEWTSVIVVLTLATAALLALHAWLPPSLLLPPAALLVASAVSLVLIRTHCWRWRTAAVTVIVLAALFTTAEVSMTVSSSNGTVAPDSPFPEIDALLRQRGFSGAILVARNGRILLNKGYGYADRTGRMANTPQTRLPIGSVTKQFTAMAILILADEGKLDVQDRICQYLDDCPAAWRDVTIHQLLTNSSGIPDFFVPCFAGRDAIQQAIAQASRQPLLFRPGERFEYSNVGYFLLGKIIEQVAERPYEAVLQDRILAPLAMHDTGLSPRTPQAVGYLNNFLPACHMELEAYFSEGGLYSTVEDLYRWDQALYTPDLISRQSLDAMFTAHVATPLQFLSSPLSYGYGWAVGRQHGGVMMMHGGFVPGFTSVIARYPDDHLTVVILSNQQQYKGGSITEAVIQEILDAQF